MATQRMITMKPAFIAGMGTLTPKEMQQVISKIEMLCRDPLPDGKVKKHLTHLHGKPYRIRSGDYRILYKFDAVSVGVLALRKRDEATYKQGVDADDELELDLAEDFEELDGDAQAARSDRQDWRHYSQPRQPQSKALPEPVTIELLNNLHIPTVYHPRLLPLKTQDDLLGCPGVPDELLLRIDQHMFDLPLVQIEQQPDLILNDPKDLQRYNEGELLAFLLKLSPEQEKYAQWSLNASGPMLVKGGPGTGKSTVALYRIRSLLQQLQQAGMASPELLFTTYTNTLVKSSEQLLQQLLGEEARHVRMRSADQIVYEVLQSAEPGIIDVGLLNHLTRQAIVEIPFTGNTLQQQAQRQTLEKIGYDYLLQEFNMVIVARQLESLDDYLATPRAGRKVRLNATQRTLVWSMYERWCALLGTSGKETWQQRHVRAWRQVERGEKWGRYDAVIIDEAQDLDPCVLRLLIKLCKAPNRIFITADANQSIYGSGFTWSDVHTSLKFQGRTSILRSNYRSTREIGEATQSYLAYGALEPEAVERQYVNSGPLPHVRSVGTGEHEAQLLANFYKQTSRELRLTLGSCALLCPSARACQVIVSALNSKGLEATYMKGRELDLRRSGIKVLTLSSAKGLEFPIVALAGFVGSSYPIIPRGASDDERDEVLARERRTMFVGMTRAMRALLVIVPVNPQTPLLTGFDPTYWNMGDVNR